MKNRRAAVMIRGASFSCQILMDSQKEEFVLLYASHICKYQDIRGDFILKRVFSCVIAIMTVFCLLAPAAEVEAASADSKAGIVATSSGSLNVRSSASTSGAAVKTLAKGSYVTLLSRSGSWWKVEYAKDRYGYCHADYINTVPATAASVSLQSGSLNVRSGAGTSHGKVGSLYHAETVVVLSSSGDWSRILYHGTKTGWVSSRYLKTSGSGGSGYAAVSLKVPSFKQNDTRWANVKIGNSGKTISQIGCATTAVAMMESYRTGKTIYPDAMSRQLRYTSSGSLYWPSHYTAVSGSGYLSGVYEQLKAGKPVLFGAKTSSGKQHWVVITGFTGGDSLTASAFSIHDPGSNSRTTLQQFLNAYPVFYKYFRY